MVIPDFKVNGKWVKSCTKEGKSVYTKSYKVWSGMLARCVKDGSFQTKQPAYEGCYTSEEFQDFQRFTTWHVNQIGYGSPLYELDKDILNHGNRCYCAEMCILVPQALNVSFTERKTGKGGLKRGVWITNNGLFASGIRVNNKRTHLGSYPTEMEAHTVYKKAKKREADIWYTRLCSGEFPADPRLVERMKNWEYKDETH